MMHCKTRVCSGWGVVWLAESFSRAHEAATLACKLCKHPHAHTNTRTHAHILFVHFFFFIVFLHFLFFLRFSTRFSKRAQPALRRCRFCRFAMQICLHENEGSCPDLPRPLASSYSCHTLLLGIGAYAFHFTYA